MRFRANFYIDGARPWEEFDWIGSDIRLGDVLFRVDRRNGRCGATNVNPVTGERDLDIPGSLRKTFGHKDLGVYLVARTGGRVVTGDQVVVPDLGTPAQETPVFTHPAPGQRSFILPRLLLHYDESKGAPPSRPEPPSRASARIGAVPTAERRSRISDLASPNWRKPCVRDHSSQSGTGPIAY